MHLEIAFRFEEHGNMDSYQCGERDGEWIHRETTNPSAPIFGGYTFFCCCDMSRVINGLRSL
jgi:hypothetical protein